MRYFLITYKEIKSGFELHRKVTVSKPSGDIAEDSKMALGIFINSTGNLKKNDIISIQELDESGTFIGEPIKPTGENRIIPAI